jgi:hypothetical protein
VPSLVLPWLPHRCKVAGVTFGPGVARPHENTIEGPPDAERLVQRLVAITQLAEQLDRGTLELALRIVPIDWWREQLGAAVPASLDAQA